MNVLKRMRNMGFLKFLLWIIVISFVMAIFTLWGGGLEYEKRGSSLFGGDYAVKVDGDSLPPAVFRLKYRFYVDRIKSMLGDNFRDSFLQGAPQNIANQMVDELILTRMAKSYGLSVSNEDLAATIQRLYNFTDPKSQYPQLLGSLGVSAQDYQTFLRTELLMEKLHDLLTSSVYLSDADLRRLYAEQNDKFKATLVQVPASRFDQQVGAITDADLKARYDQEKASLKIPEKRAIQYVMLSKNYFESRVKLSDAQLQAYYNAHQADFSIPATDRRASHILIRVAQDAKPAEVEAARKKAQEIYDKIKAGADFATMAKAYSQDSTAQRGGDLGWFSRTAMVKPFADAVFDQCKAVGDVVGPIRTQFGFHIIKLTGIGPQTKPFREVQYQVKQAMLLKDPAIQSEVQKQYDHAQKMLSSLKGDEDLKALDKGYGIKPADVAAPFGENQAIGPLGFDPELSKAIFATAQGAWSKVLPYRDGGVIRFKVTTIQPAHTASFDEAKNQLRQEIQNDRASAFAKTAASVLLAGAKDATSLEADAKKDSYTPQQVGPLTATDTIPNVGKDPEVNKAFLAAKAGDKVGPISTKTGWVVGIVTDRTNADMKKFEEDKDQFAQTQAGKVAEQWMNDYVERQRQALDAKKAIRFNESLIKEMEPASAKQAG